MLRDALYQRLLSWSPRTSLSRDWLRFPQGLVEMSHLPHADPGKQRLTVGFDLGWQHPGAGG